ncbi:MAG: hypothetical protein ACYC0C_15895 [Devosia sp.]
MAGKENTSQQGRAEAVQVFRQFAWNLAGTLVNVKGGTRRVSVRPRPAKPAAQR